MALEVPANNPSPDSGLTVALIAEHLGITVKKVRGYISYYLWLRSFEIANSDGRLVFSPKILAEIRKLMNKDNRGKTQGITARYKKNATKIEQYGLLYVTAHVVRIMLCSNDRRRYGFTIEVGRLQKVTVSYGDKRDLALRVGELVLAFDFMKNIEFHYEVEGETFEDHEGRILKESAAFGRFNTPGEMYQFIKTYLNVV
jgi:hypothetical protein